jgi:predicted TIM-barrel fold metal-dependent hydrolase
VVQRYLVPEGGTDMTWMSSADCHLMEPGDLWVTRLPEKFKERAPRYDYTDTHRIWSVEGKAYLKEPLATEAHEDGVPIAVPNSPDDVPLRLKELEADGIWAETIFGNTGVGCLGYQDPDFAMACAQAFNTYAAEVFGPYRDREIVIAPIPVRDIPAAVAEIERVAGLGLRGIGLPQTPPSPYFLDDYEPIWAAAEAHGLPISFHVGTGGNPFAGAAGLLEGMGNPSPRAQRSMTSFANVILTLAPQQLVAALVGGGVLAEHPGLEIVIVESGAGWLAPFMESLDFAWVPKQGARRDTERPKGIDPEGNEVERLGFELKKGGWPFELTPSELVRRQVHVTFMDEPAPLQFLDVTGVEPILWGSDFPHPEGTWPRSQPVTEELFARCGVSGADKDAILGGNLARIYGIEVPTDV